jgi:hypothetical protein
MYLRIDRKFIMCLLLAMFSIVMFSTALHLPTTAIAAKATAKKVIEYGWDAPTPNFFRQNIKAMEQLPFDGLGIKLNAGRDVFKKTAYSNTAFAQDRKDLAATKSSRLTDNFALMWSGLDEGWDWFNDTDWAAADRNIHNFAKTAKVGRLRGILFDSEPYNGNPWEYSKQFQHQTKTFSEYQQQVRKRGAQFMTAIQSEQPDTQVLTLGLLSWMKHLTKMEPSKRQQELIKHNYGLWPSFVNGMLDVAQSSTKIVDGNEWSYYFSQVGDFDKSHNLIFKDSRVFVDRVNNRKYTNNVKLGQSVYLDLLLNLFSADAKDTLRDLYGKTMPHFLSQKDRLLLLEHNVYHALRTTDRYAWVYGERLDWWQNKVPNNAEVTAAIRRAKTKIAKGQPLGFNIDSAVKKAVQNCKGTYKDCALTIHSDLYGS